MPEFSNHDKSPNPPRTPKGIIGDHIHSYAERAESYKHSPIEQDQDVFTKWVQIVKEFRDYEDAGYVSKETSTAILAGIMTETERAGLRDTRTGLMNDLGFKLELARALNHLKRHPSEEISVIFFDLDGFKAVNDTLGHDTGDVALAAAGQYIASNLWEFDVVARLQGDEFVALVEGNSEAVVEKFSNLRDTAMPLAVNAAIQQHDPSLNVSNISVSTSLGRTRLVIDDTVESVIKRSDIAMYQDKQERKAGR